jgi:hypothetical protein
MSDYELPDLPADVYKRGIWKFWRLMALVILWLGTGIALHYLAGRSYLHCWKLCIVDDFLDSPELLGRRDRYSVALAIWSWSWILLPIGLAIFTTRKRPQTEGRVHELRDPFASSDSQEK